VPRSGLAEASGGQLAGLSKIRPRPSSRRTPRRALRGLGDEIVEHQGPAVDDQAANASLNQLITS
jgi:hypothetical protein